MTRFRRLVLNATMVLGIAVCLGGGFLNVYVEGFGDSGTKMTIEKEQLFKRLSLVIPISGAAVAISSAVTLYLHDRKMD